MDLILCRSLWGVSEPWATSFPRFAEQGFGAIETGIQGMKPADGERLRATLAAHGLRLAAMGFTGGGTDPDAHLASLRRIAAEAIAFAPLVLNLHSGSDRWSLAERVRFYRECVAIARDLPFPVTHETHRGRCFYSPWTTAEVLDQVDGLWLCADYSHWCVVAERLLDGEEALLARCHARVRHIHARVGHAEGPQVSDPRAPEWQAAVAAHEGWWDAIWRAQAAAGVAVSTVTPEFGPPDYMPTLPWTRQPVADLDAIVRWQADRQRARFAARSA